MCRRIVLISASIAVSALALIFVLRDVPLNDVLASISRAHLFWVIACVVLVIIAIWTRALRWRILLDNRINPRDAFFILGITFMLNQLPLRAGEIARSLLATRHKVPFATAATSIVIERLLDTLLVVLLIAVSLTQLPHVEAQIANAALVFGLVGLLAFVLLLYFAHYPQMAHRLLNLILRLLPFLSPLPLSHWLDHILEGLKPLQNWRTFLLALLCTLISWSFSLLILYFSIRALDISESPLLVSFLGMGLASLSIAVPTTLAGLGLIEGAIKLTGNIVAMNDVASTALGFLFHGLTIFGYILIGVPGMWMEGISLSEILQTNKAKTIDNP